jgi:outer membrane protein assembly factor BamB
VKWKVALEHQGNSTPIIWGDKIFLTQANKGGTTRSLICLDRANGKILWQKDISYDKKEQNYNESWYCNASPSTDGERVLACYGSAGLYCYDFDGKELWKRTDLGEMQDGFGNGASPVLHGDMVIQWCGPNNRGGGKARGRNYLLAANKKTGKTIWEHDESFGSWSTPLVAEVNGQEQVLVGQSRDVKGRPEADWGYLKGFDPKTGTELWKCQGHNSYVYTSPLVGEGVAVGMSGFGGSAFAVKLGSSGDITRERLWMQPRPANQRVGSGVIVDGHVYIIDENGIPRCYDLKTGKNLWENEGKIRSGLTWGSMVHADGRLYTLMRNGETIILAAKPKFEILSVNPLAKGEQTNSSFAISDGEIFIRTFKHLWCISDKK